MPGLTGKRKQPEPASSDAFVALHRARFVDWHPTAVTALAATTDGTAVAVARESGAIELWSTEHWQCLKRIPGKEQASISTLAWTFDTTSMSWRLFSGGLDGLLTEWDLVTLRAISVTDSFGGAVWSMTAETQQGDSQRVAVACDDGALRIFEAQPGVQGLQYVKSFPRTDGRVLSAAWHPDTKSIVTGTSSGVMHVWDMQSNQELQRITAGSSTGGEDCIWSVAVLPDGTMVSGDSTGGVQLWDSQHGTLLQAFHQHKADVLSVAASSDGNMVFATGIDTQVACFKRIPAAGANQEKWVYVDTRRPHTHDVRAMLTITPPAAEPLLLTGGNDAQLFAFSVPHFQTAHPVRVCKVPERPAVHLSAPSSTAQQPVRLLTIQARHVDLWQTASTAPSPSQAATAAAATSVNLAAFPSHLAHIKKCGPHHIICGALSPDGTLLAFSDIEGIRCYQLSADTSSVTEATAAVMTDGTAPDAQATASGAEATQAVPAGAGVEHQAAAKAEAKHTLQRLSMPENVPAFQDMHFRPGSHQLVGLTPEGNLLVVDCIQNQIVAELTDLTQKLQLSYHALQQQQPKPLAASQLAPQAACLSISPTGKWAAVVVQTHVHIFDLETRAHLGRLPALQDSAPVTAVTFSASGTGLIVANASNHIGVYNVETLSATDWMKSNGSKLPARLLDMPGSIASISAHPQAPELIVATPSCACHISLRHQLPVELVAPKKSPWGKEYPYQSTNPVTDPSDAGENFRILPLAHPVLKLAYTSPSSLLLVDKPWEDVFQGLPEPLYRHRYGT